MIVANNWTTALYGALTAKGFIGERLIEFCEIVASGSAPSVIGKPFVTVDVGTIPGPSVGTGVGVVGIVPSVVSSTMLGLMSSFGWTGERMFDICDAVAQTLVAQMETASLNSINYPVFVGVGTIVPGSILVVAPEWSNNIMEQGVSKGFIGTEWPMMANAIGTASASGFVTATGTLALVGQFAGPVPPGPIPGVGVGSGTVS